MMRVCVIGNCQATGLANWARLMMPESDVQSFSLAGVDPDDSLPRAVWRDLLDRSDLVITQVGPAHQARFGIPSVEAIQAEGRRSLPAPWIIFRGFHPDCALLFDKGVIVNAAAGPYHSSIAAAAYLEGLDEARALTLFNALTFSALGYFDAFGAAADIMSDEWAAIGLDASVWLTKPLHPFMSTINHPVSEVLGDVMRQLLQRAGIAAVEPETSANDTLISQGVWPIYPEIAGRLGLTGSTDFVLPDRPVSREAQVAGTYAALRAMGAPETVADVGGDHPASKPVIDRARAFIRNYVKR